MITPVRVMLTNSDQLSHRILLSPFLGTFIVLSQVSFVQSGDLRDQGVVRVGVT